MTYPHRYERETVFTGCGWPYRCRCGEGDAYGGERGDNCPAALRQHIADLSQLQASIHKAASAAVEADRKAIGAWLRADAVAREDESGRPSWQAVALRQAANIIEAGEHIAKENAWPPNNSPRSRRG